jgi:hypothetical protein
MQTCEENHDMIVFDSQNCPLCAVIEESGGFKDALDTANAKIESLQEEIDSHECEK